MKTYMVLVRHGATNWNYESRAQGHTDIPLNQEGERQAQAVAARLATERWDAIYSSDLSRAFQTATAIGGQVGLPIQVEQRLRERGMGLSEGTTGPERQQRWPGLPWEQIPGRESDAELADRALTALTEIAQSHPGQRVVVVTHGGLIRSLLERIGGEENLSGVPRNTGVLPILWDGERFSSVGAQRFEHLLIAGVEYSAEKLRLILGGAKAGLPGLSISPAEADPFFRNAGAVESAWVGDRLVGLLRAFTDQVRYGYVDLLTCQPGYEQVLPILMKRLEARFPQVSFTYVGAAAESDGAAETQEESAPA